jgi:Mg/Co/Ni transporter MgtE
MSSKDPKQPTPALLSTREIVTTTAVGLVVSLFCYLVVPDLFVAALTLTVLFALTMAILTPLAYRNARKHGEWPPKDQRS